ncbi:MAG TPA: MFS transporter [Solirubrobacteraceae bacterium]|nr:MFS transporter [Solirubrobacteraceae bacterium]
MLLYPVYALLFADAGLSTAEISSLFAVWSITSFTLEIPSGVWSDGRSRRLLLTIAPLLAGTGFAVWVVAPSYPAFLAGFVLWGVQGALQSGALEALVYEELEHAGAAHRYAQVIGRATAVGTVAATVAIGAAAPVFAAGGFVAVGAASVLACVAAAAVAAGFPEHRVPSDGDVATGFRRYRAILADGVAEVRSAPSVRAALLLVPAVTAVWGTLDEYVPLLAADTGVSDETVPLLFLLVYVGVTLGGLLGGAASALSKPALGALLAVAAVALAAGALSGAPLGFVLVAASFCVFQAVTVVADARLQEAITGRARATVTSLAGFATEVLVVAVFAAYAAGSAVAGHATLFAAFAALYLVVAAALIASSRDR